MQAFIMWMIIPSSLTKSLRDQPLSHHWVGGGRALELTVLKLLPSVRRPSCLTPHAPAYSSSSSSSFAFCGLDYDDPLVDQIRPDWEAKLAAVRAAVARRANRRIIMRQVGDRLIPVGVTSGRIHPLAGADLAPGPIGEEGGADPIQEGRLGRRARRRQQQQAEQQQNRDLNQLLGTMGLGGQDLEEVSTISC